MCPVCDRGRDGTAVRGELIWESTTTTTTTITNSRILYHESEEKGRSSSITGSTNTSPPSRHVLLLIYLSPVLKKNIITSIYKWEIERSIDGGTSKAGLKPASAAAADSESGGATIATAAATADRKPKYVDMVLEVCYCTAV